MDPSAGDWQVHGHTPTLWPQSLRRVTSPGSLVTRVPTLWNRCGLAVHRLPELELGTAERVQQMRREAPDARTAATKYARPQRSLSHSRSLDRSNAYPPDAATGKVDQKLNHSVGLDTKSYSTAGRDMKRTGEAGGFREFDDEEEARRKRRAHEAAQEVAERKAEKKKCEFCKRFSCIC